MLSLKRAVPLGPEALASPILVLGAPRSGTTWLAKIVDSHPDVVYRHEPDAAVPPPRDLEPDGIPALIGRWAVECSPKSVTKRPFFPKSWQSEWARLIRTGIAAALQTTGRLPIPDMATGWAERLAIKSIEWAEGAAMLARSLPDSRTILILRHPCGQVASVLRGNRQRRFDLKTAGTDMPFDESRAIRHAADHGLSEAAFQALPDAGKYAWSWRAFNEPAYAALAPLTNVHVVLYEALCAQPESLAHRIMTFVGLGWTAQTEAFVLASTSHDGTAGYYAIYRNAVLAAEAWRAELASQDADAIRAVMAGSPLARFWPDLVSASPAGVGEL